MHKSCQKKRNGSIKILSNNFTAIVNLLPGMDKAKAPGLHCPGLLLLRKRRCSCTNGRNPDDIRTLCSSHYPIESCGIVPAASFLIIGLTTGARTDAVIRSHYQPFACLVRSPESSSPLESSSSPESSLSPEHPIQLLSVLCEVFTHLSSP